MWYAKSSFTSFHHHHCNPNYSTFKTHLTFTKWSINSSLQILSVFKQRQTQKRCKNMNKLLYCHYNKNIYSTSLFKYSFVIRKKKMQTRIKFTVMTWSMKHQVYILQNSYDIFIKFVAAAVDVVWNACIIILSEKRTTSVNIANEKL